tara:strand:+ start:150 stop:617 length:468 start_codon:yes stop_codon:yes gene_type:complete
MKTFKSIQKNQEQLNSLLMEKWATGKKKMEEDSTGTTPGAGKAGMHMVGGKANPSNVKQGPAKLKEEMPIDDEFEPAFQGGASEPDPAIEEFSQSMSTDATMDSAANLGAPTVAPPGRRETSYGDELPADLLEEDHNCRTAHPGMNHDQWAGKYR